MQKICSVGCPGCIIPTSHEFLELPSRPSVSRPLDVSVEWVLDWRHESESAQPEQYQNVTRQSRGLYPRQPTAPKIGQPAARSVPLRTRLGWASRHRRWCRAGLVYRKATPRPRCRCGRDSGRTRLDHLARWSYVRVANSARWSELDIWLTESRCMVSLCVVGIQT